MKKKIITVLVLLLVFGGGIGLGWYVRNQTMDPTATLPNVKVTHEPDGDYHVILRPQYDPVGLFLVTETIPEIKNLPLPNEGDRIKIWGITRFDEPHNWWELHPVIGWEKL